MPFFYVGIHKAERGSEFSKLISSIWPNSLILFLEPLGTKYTYTHSHTHTLSLSVSLSLELVWIHKGMMPNGLHFVFTGRVPIISLNFCTENAMQMLH